MGLDAVPIWLMFVGTMVLVLGAIEVGYRAGGAAHRRSAGEKESPSSGVSSAALGLTAFILAFTFALVAERYQTRKSLVLEDANAIRTSYVRADFVPEPDRSESKQLLASYLSKRLQFAQTQDIERDQKPFLVESERIQRRLWQIAVANAERDMNSDVAALYIESLNELSAIHASRLTIGVRTRVPMGIWAVLYGLTILGMLSMGYHAGISGSERSKATVIVALSFGMVIALIAALHRPTSYIRIAQLPLEDLQAYIAVDEAARRVAPP